MANSTKHAGFYRWDDIAQLIPISKPVWWKGVKNGRYPKQYRLSDNTVGWLKYEIHLLIRFIRENGVPPKDFEWSKFVINHQPPIETIEAEKHDQDN